MSSSALRVLSLCVCVSLTACGPRTGDDPHHHDGVDPVPTAHVETGGEPTVRLTGLRGIRIMTAPPPREEGAWFPGEAISDESGEVVLSSPVRGIVASAPAPPGRPVTRRAVLLSIRSSEHAELVGRVRAARAELERARATLAREERLAAGGATSAREVEDARRAAAAAQAESDSARIGLETRGLDESDGTGPVAVRAPHDGAVLRWSVLEGQGVEPGQHLGNFQTSAARIIHVELPLPGPDWKLGDATEVRTSDGHHFTAKVVGIPAALSSDTRRMAYRLKLDQAPFPIPGRPVEVRVPFAQGVILPQAAVQRIEGTWGVFVKSGDIAVFRPIRRGVELGSDVTVPVGVTPGEEIVADGAYLLKSLWLKARSGGDEHEH